MSADHPAAQGTAVGAFVVSYFTNFLPVITGLVVLAYYVFLLLDLPAFKRFTAWIGSKLRRGPVLPVLFAACALALACGTAALAKDDDDAEKWHVGEVAGASGIFCLSADAATRAFELTAPAHASGMAFSAFLDQIRPLGCVFAQNVPVKFLGPEATPILTAADGTECALVSFTDGQTVVFTYLPAAVISPKPLPPAGDAI